ncbi:MAG: hypothetical protein H6741_18300 [Alphaproteobacteria bacterium]|nr:hypothetical protein [Alphaproteobacteria bacterium]
MPPDLRAPLVGVALLAGCDRPDPPSEEALEACEGQSLGETGFDWSCCEVWTQECRADWTRRQSECDWICNG